MLIGTITILSILFLGGSAGSEMPWMFQMGELTPEVLSAGEPLDRANQAILNAPYKLYCTSHVRRGSISMCTSSPPPALRTSLDSGTADRYAYIRTSVPNDPILDAPPLRFSRDRRLRGLDRSRVFPLLGRNR